MHLITKPAGSMKSQGRCVAYGVKEEEEPTAVDDSCKGHRSLLLVPCPQPAAPACCRWPYQLSAPAGSAVT